MYPTAHLLLSASVLLTLLTPHAAAQGSGDQGDGPDWVFADSNLVNSPTWISATVSKNVVILAFKPGTSVAKRTSIIKLIHGVIVHYDGVLDAYLIRVATHPDACSVEQAMDFLGTVPEVRMADPELVFTTNDSDSIDPGGGLVNAPATHHGSKRPCPPGIGLLR
jgi:hypothetical protein